MTSNGFGDVDGEMDVDESIPDPLLSTIIGDRSSSLGDRSKICIVERRDVTNGELIGVDLLLKYWILEVEVLLKRWDDERRWDETRDWFFDEDSTDLAFFLRFVFSIDSVLNCISPVTVDNLNSNY